jgi:TonB family protein
MREPWKESEGRVINREFRLGEYVGGSERAGVFMTQYGPESLKAAVKLIPIGTWDQATVDGEISRLQSASELSHTHLLRIFQAGRATLDDTDLIFVVMEAAEEDLAQFLPKRALTPGEVREMLEPTLEALAYLHGRGFVHGGLKPANVMAIGDQLKLSSDRISPIGQRNGAPRERSEQDPPEMARAGNLAASEIWSLGVLLSVALTRRLPVWEDGGEEPQLPENLPPPFDDIVGNCLRREPSARWSLAEIAARAGVAIPETAMASAKTDVGQSAVAARATTPPRATAEHVGTSVTAAGPQLAGPRRKAVPTPRNFAYRRRSNAAAYGAAAVVLLIVGILVIPRLFRSGAINLQTDSAAEERPAVAVSAPRTARAKAARAGDSGASSKIAPVSDQAGSREVLSKTNSGAGSAKSEGFSEARGKTPRRGLTVGHVAEQVLPDVPKSASQTIRGTVRVGVRVSVDSSGNVTEAELDSPGPSKYFARLALEAAQRWKFDPPKLEGRNVLSDWRLQFQFTGGETKVSPMQSDP